MRNIPLTTDDLKRLVDKCASQQATISQLTKEADANIEQLEKELFDLRVSEDFHYARMIDAERQKQ